jgi:pimeloyl-ACP methyl ester carboxylesterase
VLQAFAGGRVFGGVSGAPPSLVLALHGWAHTHADFDPVLGGEHPLPAVALDLPGFGASPPPPEAWTTPAYAELVAEVAEELTAAAGTPPVVLGHSFGGKVAVRLAARHPDLVRGLVLTGVPLLRLGPRPTPPVRFRLARSLHRVGLVSDARMEAARQRYGSSDYRAAQGVMRQVLVANLAETYDEDLAALRCPVALVWGDDDTAAPLAVAEEVAARVPGATLTVCPGAGHLTPTTVPGALRRAVEELLG